MKKAILYLDGGFRVPVDIINYPPRKENETWEEFEKAHSRYIPQSAAEHGAQNCGYSYF
jgi:hypothetical protein